jgi:hypothetical protein
MAACCEQPNHKHKTRRAAGDSLHPVLSAAPATLVEPVGQVSQAASLAYLPSGQTADKNQQLMLHVVEVFARGHGCRDRRQPAAAADFCSTKSGEPPMCAMW